VTIKIIIDASLATESELVALSRAPGYDTFIKHIANGRRQAEDKLEFITYLFVPIEHSPPKSRLENRAKN
jgi:hypothetical protein